MMPNKKNSWANSQYVLIPFLLSHFEFDSFLDFKYLDPLGP